MTPRNVLTAQSHVSRRYRSVVFVVAVVSAVAVVSVVAVVVVVSVVEN